MILLFDDAVAQVEAAIARALAEEELFLWMCPLESNASSLFKVDDIIQWHLVHAIEDSWALEAFALVELDNRWAKVVAVDVLPSYAFHVTVCIGETIDDLLRYGINDDDIFFFSVATPNPESRVADKIKASLRII